MFPNVISNFIKKTKEVWRAISKPKSQRKAHNKTYKKMFSRWDSLKPHTWQYRIFCDYSEELTRMMFSYVATRKYTYTNITNSGGDWDKLAKDYFANTRDQTLTIRNWSENLNDFENWTMLNCAMALSSYFETYLSSVIVMALQSDPGIMIGQPHAVDGMKLLKQGKLKKKDINRIAAECTKGEWSKRQAVMQKYFGSLPESFNKNIKTLETLRILRNKVGHAFGRDIRKSRDIESATKLAMERLSSKRLLKWQRQISQIALDIDNFMLQDHIGSFQPLLAYHTLYQSLDKTDTPKARGERMMAFKKSMGGEKKDLYSKDYCRSLVCYYETL